MGSRFAVRVLVSVAYFASMASTAEPPITAIDFTREGHQLVGVSQRGLHLLQWPELEVIGVVQLPIPNLHAVSFSPDGTRIAVGGGSPAEEGRVQVVSWPEAQPGQTLHGHHDSVRAVAWLDNSDLVSASIDQSVKRWSLVQQASVATLRGHSKSVDALCALRGTNFIVTAGVDQSLRVWDFDAEEPLRSLNQHTGPVHALAVRPVQEGLPIIASASSDFTIRFWQPTIGRMIRYIRLSAAPLAITWINGGSHLVAGCDDGHIRVIDYDRLTVENDQDVMDGWVYAVKAHPFDGSVAAAGSGGTLRRVQLKSLDR